MKVQVANGLFGLLSRFCRRPKSTRRARRRIFLFAPPAAQIETLESRALLTVTYHGGALLSNVEAQAVYLGSDWSNSTLKPQSTQLDQYVTTIVNSGYMDMLTKAGYNVGRGTSSAGAIDSVALSKNASVGVTDAQIQRDLQAMITAGTVQAPDANRLYIVYVEPSVVVQLDAQDTSATTFLGYHGAFAGANKSGQSVDIHYAVIAYPGAPNFTAGQAGFNSNFDDLTAVTSHELAEAATDPNVNYKTLGWYDDQNNGEIGDLAVSNYSTIPGPGNITYLVQDAVDQNDQIITPVTTTTNLSSPNLSVSAASSTSAQLTWGSVSGATGYRVYAVNGTTNQLLTTLNSSATGYLANHLSSGSTVLFKVEAFNSSQTADSSVVSITLPNGSTTLKAPTLAVTAATSTSANLGWGTVSGATGYRVYVVHGNTRTLLATLGSTASSYTATKLTAGSTDSFQVEAFNATSIADSSVISVTLPNGTSNLTAPQITVQAVSSTVADISWGLVKGSQGYRIYEVNGSTTTLLGTVGHNTSSVSVNGLTPGSHVSFKVEAFNSTGVADSSVISVTLPNSSSLTAPQVSAFVWSSTIAELDWNTVAGATGYNIYWMNGNQKVLLGTMGANSTGVLITGLTPGATTNFVVEAFNATSVADSQVISVTTPQF